MKAIRLPSGNYYVNAYLGRDSSGRQIRKTFTGSDPKKLLRLAADFVDEHRDVQNRESLKSALRNYISDREPVLSASTVLNYVKIENSINKFFPILSKANIYSITAADLQKFVGKLSLNKSPKTVNNWYSLVMSALRASGVYINGVRLPEKTRPTLNIPDDVTVARLLKAVKGTPLEIPILLASTGPLRRGEICALTMEDIDGNTIHVCKSMALNKDRKWIIKAPKTYSSDRYVEMPDKAIDLIMSQGYVTNLNPDEVTARFERLLKREGISPFRFHDLRHYCVSMLKAHNVPDIYIMQRGGWATDSVMKNVYTHTLQNHSKKQTEIMIEEFNKIIGE